MYYITDTNKVNLPEALRILKIISSRDQVDIVVRLHALHLDKCDALIIDVDNISKITSKVIARLGGKSIISVYGIGSCSQYCNAKTIAQKIVKIEKLDLFDAIPLSIIRQD
jgi:hypothetical protein